MQLTLILLSWQVHHEDASTCMMHAQQLGQDILLLLAWATEEAMAWAVALATAVDAAEALALPKDP